MLPLTDFATLHFGASPVGDVNMSFHSSTNRSVAADRRKPSATERKRPWDGETKPEMIKRFQRCQLVDLFRHRNELQDNTLGRDNLILLLQLGLTCPEAQRLAPWCEGELEELIVTADSSTISWTAKSLGRQVELKFEEKERLKIRNIQCVDKSLAEVSAFYRNRRREHDARRKRQDRAHKRQRREERIDRLSSRAVAPKIA